MIYTCLPSGTMHGWGIAGNYIRAELAKLRECVDVSDTKVATIFPGPVLMAIQGDDGQPMNSNVFSNTRMVGYGFCERPDIAANYLENWNAFDVVVCGSTWMKDEMSRIGVKNVAVALQGVDYEIFKPSSVKPKKTPFVIFSGGKFEWRKGQDIVIAAVAKLLQKGHDVRLIAAVANFWPSTMVSMEQSEYIRYEHVSNDWAEQVVATLGANGVPLEKVLVPDIRDHAMMVELYHSAHLGLFTNRIEAGTNLVMCEAIASGLPVLATDTTGHADIVRGCSQINFDMSDGIGNIVSTIEYYMKHLRSLEVIGENGATRIRKLVSWDRCAKQLLEVLEVE